MGIFNNNNLKKICYTYYSWKISTRTNTGYKAVPGIVRAAAMTRITRNRLKPVNLRNEVRNKETEYKRCWFKWMSCEVIN